MQTLTIYPPPRACIVAIPRSDGELLIVLAPLAHGMEGIGVVVGDEWIPPSARPAWLMLPAATETEALALNERLFAEWESKPSHVGADGFAEYFRRRDRMQGRTPCSLEGRSARPGGEPAPDSEFSA